MCVLLIILSLSCNAPRITITSANNTDETASTGEAFVDDTGLETNKVTTSATPHRTSSSPSENNDYYPLVNNLQNLAWEWEHLLLSTGGALNLEKCFWFLLTWQGHQGIAKLHTTKTANYNLQMTSEHNPMTTEVRRIEPSSSYQTLGVYISPSGDSKGAFKVLREVALEYCSNIVASMLTRKETLTNIFNTCYQNWDISG